MRQAAILAVAALALGGCAASPVGDPPPRTAPRVEASGSPGPVDPCSIVGREALDDLMNELDANGRVRSTSWYAWCTASAGPYRQVDLTVSRDRDIVDDPKAADLHCRNEIEQSKADHSRELSAWSPAAAGHEPVKLGDVTEIRVKSGPDPVGSFQNMITVLLLACRAGDFLSIDFRGVNFTPEQAIERLAAMGERIYAAIPAVA